MPAWMKHAWLRDRHWERASTPEKRTVFPSVPPFASRAGELQGGRPQAARNGGHAKQRAQHAAVKGGGAITAAAAAVKARGQARCVRHGAKVCPSRERKPSIAAWTTEWRPRYWSGAALSRLYVAATVAVRVGQRRSNFWPPPLPTANYLLRRISALRSRAHRPVTLVIQCCH